MTRRLDVVVAAFAASLTPFVLIAAPTIVVPTDQPTIADAIANIDPGGTIILMPGTYGAVATAGKDFTLRSTNPNDSATVAATRIEAPTSRALKVELGSTVSVRGLTLYSGDDNAILVIDSSDLQVLRCTLTGFPGPDSSGGGARVDSGSNADFVQTSFVNSIARSGAGLYVLGTATVTDSLISGNTADATGGSGTASGAGVYLGGSGTLTIDRTIITGNIVIPAASPSTSNAGAGVQTTGNSLVITNSLITNNTAYASAGVYSNNSDLIVINSTVADNTSTNNYGGLDATGTTSIYLYNSILHGNTDGTPNDNDDLRLGSLATAVVEYNNIGSVAASGTNISADPKFINPAAGNYRIRPGSPSIDAGDNTLISTATDLLGNPRFRDDTGTPDTGVGPAPVVDQGAYEFQGTTCALDLNGDNILDNGDIIAFVALFLAGDLAVDINGDGLLDNGDISAFVGAFLAGC